MGDRGRSGVTISDVAAAADVSRQTVSNVLNAPGRVAAGTAARVRQAIEELGYRPNRAAQNLRERTSRCIGFEIGSSGRMSNLLDRFLHTLAEAAGTSDYHMLLFASSGMDEELSTYQDLISTGTVDGFVLADVGLRDLRLSWFAQRGIPFVCFGRPWGQEHERFSWVDVDGAYGIAQAVDHLASRGHRRIAYLGWPDGTGFGDERRAGWREAMLRQALEHEGLSGASGEDVTAASAVARCLLAQPDPPTAFACGSDTHAFAARLAGGVGAEGLPKVEVVGFDDSPAATLMSPPMSSIRQPLAQVAHRVVGLLIEQLHGSCSPPEGVMLRPELVARDRGRLEGGR